MTLTQLRYAITVANSDSMNEAARNLFISQPSLSAAIKELEEEAGIEIFRRTNRGISVTPEGEEFIGYARQVVEQYNLIENKYIDKKDQLVMRQRENGKMQTLIDYESGQVYNTDGTLMETNEEIMIARQIAECLQ